MWNKLIQQVIIIADCRYNLFDSRNWTFYTKELFPAIREHSWVVSDMFDNVFAPFNKYFVNYYNFNYYFLNYNELISMRFKTKNNFTFRLALSFVEHYINQWYYFFYTNGTYYMSSTVELIFMGFLYSHISFYFNFLFFLLLIIKFHFDFSQVGECTRSNIVLFYQFIIYDSLTLVLNKYESSEEALCVVVLWPWCLLLVFTHLFLIDNNEVLFIFIEWGLPIVYGFFLLFEHLWNFGSYFFVYLNGGRGRRSLLIVIIEDILTFFIVIIRVSLQVVRGLLCGFFHNFFRGVYDNIFDLYHMYAYYADWTVPFFYTSSTLSDVVTFGLSWYLIAFTLLFVYIILFLQLLFLLIAVWLFCRCWFISSSNTSTEETVIVDHLWNRKMDYIDSRHDDNLKAWLKNNR